MKKILLACCLMSASTSLFAGNDETTDKYPRGIWIGTNYLTTSRNDFGGTWRGQIGVSRDVKLSGQRYLQPRFMFGHTEYAGKNAMTNALRESGNGGDSKFAPDK